MWYWQNKNGQTIIKNYSGTDCQALKTWLNGFEPFRDLTAINGATCGSSPALGATTATGLVGYVYNIVKAANASGTSMNAMLKAQMLATALDVYFSDSALGGNRISAPAPIGGVSVDLTKICTDLTCTAFEDTSTATSFGGATSLKVWQMLSYAASQCLGSSPPGSCSFSSGPGTWYGNVKFPTQEYAKDAFDAINNQKVFSPSP